MEPYKSKFNILRPFDETIWIRHKTIPEQYHDLIQHELFSLGYEWVFSKCELMIMKSVQDTHEYLKISYYNKILTNVNVEDLPKSCTHLIFDFNQVFQPKPELDGFFASKRLGL